LRPRKGAYDQASEIAVGLVVGVGVCWVAVAIAYLTNSETLPVVPLLISLVVLLLVPLVLIDVLGGMAEWPQRRQKH
jgi:Na+/H+-dicarboxylate symporter